MTRFLLRSQPLPLRLRSTLASTLAVSVSAAALGAEPPPKSRVKAESLTALKRDFPYAVRPASASSLALGGKDVIVMAPLTVKAPHLPEFSENEILTDKGLSELFLKRYPGQSFKGQAATESNLVQVPNYAAMSHRDDVRQRTMDQLGELAETLRHAGEEKAAKQLKRAMYDTFLRNPTDREKAMAKSYNGGR